MKTTRPVLALFLAAGTGALIVSVFVQADSEKSGKQRGGRIAAIEARFAKLEAKYEALLVGVTRGTDANTGCDTLTFTGMNVQIVNGLDLTATANGCGNLIVGYNELRSGGGERTGSHMLVAGTGNNYSSFGGIIVGYLNTTSGEYASVSGGETNIASGRVASVSGGASNRADAARASVSGGVDNLADGVGSSVSGGTVNRASEQVASVSGGTHNTASAYAATVSGGAGNTANFSSATVSGGRNRSAGGQGSWAAGSMSEVN